VSTPALAPSRLLSSDLFGVGSIGLRTRKLRAALSAVGVAIGIASMVAVLGISASSQAELLSTIDKLGTNLLTVQAGQSFFGGSSELPQKTGVKIASMRGVNDASAVYTVTGATARRNELVDVNETSGIAVQATDLNLPKTLSAELADGHFLTPAEARYPTVVLGSVAAERLGIDSVGGSPQVYIGGQYYTVVGILKSVTLATDVDRAALIGLPQAKRAFSTKAHPSSQYVRTSDGDLKAVRALVPATANPEHPEEVQVSRPSDALVAKAAAKGAFTSLLLGLGAVALLVGGVGIANVMVISVLERRSEIGLRRALGATRRHISAQFLTESLLLASTGGAVGAALGALVTAIYSTVQGQSTVVPILAIVGGMAAALLIGAIAGLYPSVRASRLSPTEALRTV
jgi:putative ABC transport system permease protein